MAHATPLRARRLAFPIVASIAIVVCSVAFGVAFRSAMRVAALIDHSPPAFDLETSLALVGAAALVGAILAIPFVLVGSRFRATSWSKKSRIFAVAVFVFPTLPFLLLDPRIPEVGNQVVNWLLFGALLPLFALALGALLDALDPRSSARDVLHTIDA